MGRTDKLADISHLDTLSVEQAALLLHLGRDSTRELIDAGEIPALACNQKHTVLLRNDVLDYIAREARKQADSRKSKAMQRVSRPRRRAGRKLPDLDKFNEEPHHE